MNSREDFYAKCSLILGIEHDYHEPYAKRTRWNNRRRGNGRFVGFGLVQCFGGFVRVVTKRDGVKIFRDYEEVYNYLREVVER